jgi:putative ABC transport system permease protein
MGLRGIHLGMRFARNSLPAPSFRNASDVSGVSQVKASAGVTMGNLLLDVRYSLRNLFARPGFTFVAVLTLALGIGANTAIFSVIDGLLLRSLPFNEPHRLVMVWEQNYLRGQNHNVVGPANYLRWEERNQVFDQMAAFNTFNSILTGEGEPQQIPIGFVSHNFFDLLGVQAHIGRVFLPEEAQSGESNVVLLANGFWQNHFGSDPGIIGKTITLDGNTMQVIGVMPPGFNMPSEVNIWMPQVFTERHRTWRGRYLAVLARMRPDVAMEEAQAGMNVLAKQLEKEDPDFNNGWGVQVIPLHEELTGGIRRSLIVLLGAVGFVLLIACVNVANLLIAQAAGRKKELALRAALGADRKRLVQQLLTESTILAVMGGGAGLLVASFGLEGLLAIAPDEIPSFVQISLNTQVLGFTLVISLLTGLMFGLAPALQVSGLNLHGVLKVGGRASIGALSHHRLRNLLVVTEVALALVLLVGAGLLIRSFAVLLAVDPGFRPGNLLTMSIQLPESKYRLPHQQAAFFQQAVDRARNVPGVESSAAISFLPMAGPGAGTAFMIEGRPAPAAGEAEIAEIRSITKDYFRTMGIALLRGRFFGDPDGPDDPKKIIINETMADRFWPGEDPVGKFVVMFWGEQVRGEIVGVVGDVRHSGLDTSPRPTLHWFIPQFPYSFMTLVARTSVDPLSLSAALRSEIAGIDPDQPVARIQPMNQVLSDSVKRPRFTMLLLGAFSAIALLLAAVGIYGVVSYFVGERTHEIGVRMALGARRFDVLRLVVGQGMVLTIAGVAIGLVVASYLMSVMSRLLFGVTPTDPITYATISILLTAIALIACYIPAHRATRLDPLVALRNE